jgi:tRNA threonylcarbamoyladenosine biosynthesis protein TsaB
MLGIECTASPVSCAVFNDGKLVAENFLDIKTTHSETLMPMVEHTLSLLNLNINDIDVFAVTVGPGSFTGVRIGVSAVKGLTAANKKSIVPVSVLQAMAYNMSAFDCYVCAVMDARCNQFYNAIFRIKNGEVERITPDRALLCDDLLAEIKELSARDSLPIFAVGDGADMFYKSTENQIKTVKLAPVHLKRQRAAGVCLAAEKDFKNGKMVTSEELLPLYLRLPQAERELKSKLERGK